MSINLDFDKEKQVVKFLEQAKKKLAQYEAYSLRDGHINAFEEYTLDKLRELIQKIEEKIANSKSLAFDFGPETSYLNTSKSLKVNLVKSYQKSESVPMQIQQNFLEINTHFSWLSDMNYTEQYNSIDEKKLHHYSIHNHYAQAFTWLKWYAGDTEVGGIFSNKTSKLIALINDGYIDYT